MKLNHYVKYVIGTFLAFPIVVIHVLPCVESSPKKKHPKRRQPQQNYMPSGKEQPSPPVTQQGVKRTCGNAQKSVRVKHSSIPALKHK